MKDDMVLLLQELRDLSYETGYIAGKIEAGTKQDEVEEEYQRKKICQRNVCYEILLDMVDKLEERLADLLSLARTGLKPDIYATEKEWIEHRINKVAAELDHIINK